MFKKLSFYITVVYLLILIQLLSIDCFAQWNFNMVGNDQKTPQYWGGPDAEGWYQLTTEVDVNNQINTTRETTAMWNTNSDNTIYLEQDFIIKFRLNFGRKNEDGADGIAFVLQDYWDGAIKACCGWLGFAHQDEDERYNCFAIEFDTYVNTNDNYFYDPWDDHLADKDHIFFSKDGDLSVDPPVFGQPVPAKYSGDPNNPYENIEDEIDHCIVITWDSDEMKISVYFDEVLRKSHTFASLDDIIPEVEGTDPLIWGITASTGVRTNLQTVKFDYLNTNASCDAELIVEEVGSDPVEFYVCEEIEKKFKVCYKGGEKIKLKADVLKPENYPNPSDVTSDGTF